MAFSIFPEITTEAVTLPDPPKEYKSKVVRTANVRAIIVGHLVNIADLFYGGAVQQWPAGYLERRPSFGDTDAAAFGRWGNVSQSASAEVERLKNYHPGF